MVIIFLLWFSVLSLFALCSHAAEPFLFVVRGTSMLPAVRPGDIVFPDYSVGYDGVRPGDICIFRPHFFIGRVIHRSRIPYGLFRKVWIMKGDNNAVADPNWMDRENFVCVVHFIVHPAR